MTSIMREVLRTLVRFPAEFIRLLLYFLLLLFWWIWSLILWLFGRDRPRRPRKHCPCPDKVPEHVRRRPDPCLYSQSYLMQQGVPVTWNNPDIWLTELDGTPVSSSDLEADHTYLVIGRIWNASFDAALGVSVRCIVRNWGISSSAFTPVETNPDGSETIRFLNIGPWGHAIAQFTWKTPKEGGHYCIKVECAHSDDLNTANNVGQENTRVHSAAAGQTIAFPMEVFNPARMPTRLIVRLDTYEIPKREWHIPLEEREVLLGRGPRIFAREEKKTAMAGIRRWVVGTSGRGPSFTHWRYIGRRELFDEQRKAALPVPDGWQLQLDGASAEEGLTLAARETRQIQISVSIPASAASGSKVPINLSVWAADVGPLGGVTFSIEVQ